MASEQEKMQHSRLEEGPPQKKQGAPPAVLPKQNLGHAPFLGKLGLLEFYPNKLTLQSLMTISHDTLSDKAVQSLKDVPLAFLRKLLMVNAKCWNCSCAYSEKTRHKDSDDDDDGDEDEDEKEDEDDEAEDDYADNTKVNPLDLVTALYLCADSFLQQEMAIKMSMCQFAIPFILPQIDDNHCSLMLWALRNIYKEWLPPDLLHTKNYVEDSVVHAQIPLLSFVRLSKCSLSKSQLLNNVLSNAQQNINVFTHRDMTGGNAPKKIANGLVEIAWCLPSGKSTIDVFPEPVAIANMRGEMRSFDTQFSFLMEVSAAVFVFLDTMTEEESKLLDLQGSLKSKLFLVINSQKRALQKKYAATLKLKEDRVLRREQRLNMAESSSLITNAMMKALKECNCTITLEEMSGIAHNMGISVDENKSKASVSAKETANNILKDIGVCPIADYKKIQLPLQGEFLKKLATIEIEECRLQNAGSLSLEEHKTQLREKKRKLREEQSTIKISQAAEDFIQALSTTDKDERTFFLRWMALQLDRKSRKHLTELRRVFKEVCQGKDQKSIKELDQKLLDNSLGIEHYLREMGQIYEAKPLDAATKPLPEIAAELLLDGYPIELLDGDASNIPEKWVSAVLLEVHQKVGQSRLLVVSVLGVQSTGKSTLLNTMFGVQFPVSSGRCTRGAYMLLLSLHHELREELNCDFVLLIDTEGLKSPALAHLDDSYEHDNQLATLVIGLSDVTIINIAMENSTEMKDVLQIAVHAFLRMKYLGKKPVCHFVHQNVSGVSAHSKLMTDREHFLEQLNKITEIAAGMEKVEEMKKFTDVLSYDMEKNNWYIPGLWNGTPPMAPVNSGYSEAVREFKESLLQSVHTKNVAEIPDFLDWMSSLWKSVKYENFIFSFRNTLVAYAYDSLCKEFSEWEWCFRKTVYSWMNNAETRISNANSVRMTRLLQDLELESDKVIDDQTAEMNKKLRDYYKRRDMYVNLVERYKSEFEININFIAGDMLRFVAEQLNAALSLKKNMEQVETIQKKRTDFIENQVMMLLNTCKTRDMGLSDDDLENQFEKMWSEVTTNIVSPLEEHDIKGCVMKQLRSNLRRRSVHEQLEKITDLDACGRQKFQVKQEHFSTPQKIKNIMPLGYRNILIEPETQDVANSIIQRCEKFIEEVSKSKKDYQDTYSNELLEKIDTDLMKIAKHTNSTFEVELKAHICGIASMRFSEMHQQFLAEKDPRNHLEKCKKQYLSDFIDSYRQRDQCLKKAQDLSQLCIKPAITEYVNKCLGIVIVDGILCNSPQYHSRSYFQYAVLSELLEKDNFDDFVKYLVNYETFVKDLIYNQIVEWLSKDNKLIELNKAILKKVLTKITKIVKNQSDICDPNEPEKAAVFVERLCLDLSKEISLNSNTIRGVLFQMSCDRAPFIDNLLQGLENLRNKLEKQLSESSNIEDTLNVLTVKPQNVLFTKVFGCGEQCPFCKIPCDAEGKAHKKHHATVHRPQGLGTIAWRTSQTLVETLCTTSVYSGTRFRNEDTNNEWHPCKDYHEFYPQWSIAPDPSIQASDYWKYVLVKYNDRFAKEYNKNPAVCPEEWHSITKEKALDGLKAAYNVKQQHCITDSCVLPAMLTVDSRHI